MSEIQELRRIAQGLMLELKGEILKMDDIKNEMSNMVAKVEKRMIPGIKQLEKKIKQLEEQEEQEN